jgi:hypothetical protein
LQNFNREDCHIENANSQVEFRQRSWELKPRQRVVLESSHLMQQHNSDTLIQEEQHRLNWVEREK